MACAKKAAVAVDVDAADGAKNVKWWGLEAVDAVFAHAVTTPGKGLSEEEVLVRRARFGANKMTQGKKRSFFERLWDQVRARRATGLGGSASAPNPPVVYGA
jgi:hypothetical protein